MRETVHQAALSLLVLGLALSLSAQDKYEPTAPSNLPGSAKDKIMLPRKSFISGVPFLGWGQAARLDYTDKEVLNPSWPASLAMVLKYWASESERLQPFEKRIPDMPETWKPPESQQAKTFEDLKPFIAEGVPVIVNAGLTPVAHPIEDLFLQVTGDKTPELEKHGPYSGALGRMAPYDAIRKLEARKAGVSMRESLYLASRVVIGFDDDRQKVVLHDPSFGPAWEARYEDFDKMWEPTGRLYLVLRPPDYKTLLHRPPQEPYRVRTPDEQAAEHFVFGYALSAVGRLSDARDELEQGLAISGISRGYKYLFSFELALIYFSVGKRDEAIRWAQRATELLPEYYLPWQFLAAEVYSENMIPTFKTLQAKHKAKSLAQDPTKLRDAARVLPCDFWIRSMAEVRGWCH